VRPEAEAETVVVSQGEISRRMPIQEAGEGEATTDDDVYNDGLFSYFPANLVY